MDKYVTIERFIGRYESKSTQMTYRSALKKFLTITGYKNKTFEDYFQDNRDYEEDIENFLTKLNGSPPKSVRLHINVVKIYFKKNKIRFEDDFWEDLSKRIKGKMARTKDRIPTNEELRQILTHCDAKGKALFLTLASSGMRIGEALSIKLNDVDLVKNPVEIRIRGEITKTGEQRITFISKEATQALKEWLKIRKKSLKIACQRSHRFYKNPNDDRVFPFEMPTAFRIWNYAIKKAGLEEFDSSTNRRIIHIHCLRKLFATRTSLTMPREMTEALLGHSEGLDEVYKLYSEKELIEHYKKAEENLLIFTDQETIKKYTKNLQDRQDSMNTTIANQATDIVEMKKKYESKIQELECLNSHWLNRVNSLEQKMENMIHTREEELGKAERTAITNEEYTQEFAKENPEDYQQLIAQVKALNKKLGIKVT